MKLSLTMDYAHVGPECTSATRITALMKRALLTIALIVAAASCSTPRATNDNVAATAEPVPDIFPSVPEVRAVHGVAKVELYVVLDPMTGNATFVYGASRGVAPTIRVHPGDLIDLTVHDLAHRTKGRANAVNIHFHGLTVAPTPPGDDVVTTLAQPDQTLHYRVRIPRNHEPGLYWYHPHPHGESYYQVLAGMSGALIVEGLQEHLPALRAMRERVILLRDVPTSANYVDDDMPMNGMVAHNRKLPVARVARNGKACRPEVGLSPTLNRQPRAKIAIRPGERQFFRVVNASASRYFDLSIDGATLDLVARDGVPLDAYPGTPPELVVHHLLLPPAGRAEFVVTAPNHPTVLRSACVDTGRAGDADPPAILADLDQAAHFLGLASNAANVAVAHPAEALAVGAPLPRNWYARPLPAPAVHRTVRLSEDDHAFAINGKAFTMRDMHGPPAIVARSGTVEEWTVVNDTDEIHAFHIHQVHFVNEMVDGVRAVPPAWLDTVNVPAQRRLGAGRIVPGRVRILVDFRDPVVRGEFMFHCHILDHEDNGMMATIRVI